MAGTFQSALVAACPRNRVQSTPPRYQVRTHPSCHSLCRLPFGYGVSSDG